MNTIVKDDRVMIGPEFVPRRLDLPRALKVDAGQSYTPGPDETWDYVENWGHFVFDLRRDTRFAVTTFLNMPAATFAMGSVADPLNAKVEFILRDVAIDTTRDPFQWGNGLLNFGTQTRIGSLKTSCVELTIGLKQGQTQIMLPEEPDGWHVGDEVLIPDTQMQDENHFPQREAPTFIQFINGKSLTLTKGLDFDHPPVTGPDGTAYAFPCVCNLTRNIVIRSENPAGTPGHTANVGMDTHWEIQSNLLIGLGRTTTAKIDRTSLDLKHIGTNQIARYGDHDHHAMGFMSTSINNVIRGNRVAKWGRVIHATHDSLVEDNIALDYAGAGFITEDGYEVRNVIRKNIALYCYESVVKDNTTTNLTEGRPGTEGTGFWLHGVKNHFEGNEARCCRIGFSLVNQLLAPGLYPSEPGMMPDTPYEGDFARMAVPIVNTGQIMIANFLSGYEQWGVAANDIHDLISCYQGNVQFFNFATGFPNIVRPTLIAKNGVSSGMHIGMAYTQGLRVEGGIVAGCATGLSRGGGASTTTFLGTKMQNAENFDFEFSGARIDLNDVVNTPLAGFPTRYIRLGTGKVWDGQEPLPFDGASHLPPCRGSQYILWNWNGTGEDYLLFHNQQLASTPAAYTKSDTPQHAYGLPEVGLTTGEGWAKYGLAYRGESLDDADAIELEGLFGGKARKGLISKLGAPMAVLMSPTMREPAPINPQGVKMYCALTGDPAQRDGKLYYSFDRSTDVIAMEQQSGQPLDGREFFGPSSEGTHILTLWTKDANSVHFNFKQDYQYFVGATPPQPDPVLVPNVVGKTQALAQDEIVKAGLTIGVATTKHDPSLAGLVIGQTPVAGSSVLPKTSVNLVVSLGPDVPPPTTVIVPDVVGMTHANAVSTLSALGLTPTATMQHHATIPAGHIISQAPAAGTAVNLGASVNLIESDGPTPPTPQPDETWTATTMTAEKSSKGRVRIVIG